MFNSFPAKEASVLLRSSAVTHDRTKCARGALGLIGIFNLNTAIRLVRVVPALAAFFLLAKTHVHTKRYKISVVVTKVNDSCWKVVDDVIRYPTYTV